MSDSDGPGAGFPKRKKSKKSSTPSDKSDGKSDGKDRFSQLRDMGLLSKVNELAEREVTLAFEVKIEDVNPFEDEEWDHQVSIIIDPTNVDSNYREYLRNSVEELDISNDYFGDAPSEVFQMFLKKSYPEIDFAEEFVHTDTETCDGKFEIMLTYDPDLMLSTMKEQAAEIAAYVCRYLFSVDGPVPPKTIDNRKKNGQIHNSDGIQLDFANDVSYEKARQFYKKGNQDSVEDQYLYRLKTDDVHKKEWWLQNFFQGKRDYFERFEEYKITTTISLIRNTRQPLNKQAVVVATQQVLQSVLKF